MSKTYSIVTMGCAKNTVDSEAMEQVLAADGFTPAKQPRWADVVIVNTCGFIQSATDESVDMLKQLARKKRKGQILVAAGCLAQKLGADLTRHVPQIDAVLGTRRWGEVAAIVREAQAGTRPCWTGGGAEEPVVRRKAAGASAYLKIADGCDAGCAFCAIPLIKGPYRSRPREALVAEAADLARQGVRELILVAQDTTAYGRDRGERDGLLRLVEQILAAGPGLEWLRLMYAYPTHLDEDLLRLMATEPRLLPYVDIPLQHAHPEVLRRMRRPVLDPRVVVERIRRHVPEAAIRTTFIVGYPGETEEEFASLLRFIEQARLDRVGVFAYSAEAGTVAAELPGQVPADVAQRRVEAAMLAQQQVSLDINRSFVGKTLDVLVEGTSEVEMAATGGGKRRARRSVLTCGRSYRDAPEVDGLVLFPAEARPGEMVRVRVSEALPYDLLGERV